MIPGELRYAVRALRQAPGYTLASIAVLTLGIGANAAIFSFVYAVVLKPLPYSDPGSLVFIWQRLQQVSDPLFQRLPVLRPNYLEWRRQNTVFSQMAAFCESSLNETSGEHPSQISAGFASAEFFGMLGVEARLGRLFGKDEERPGADRVALLTDTYFERRFQRDPGALGKSITVDRVVYNVIGVLPPQFHLPATSEGMNQLKPDLWLPLSRLWNGPRDEDQRQLMAVARLKRGVSLARARAEMADIMRRLVRADPKRNEGLTAAVFPFAVEDAMPALHRALSVLMAAVIFLLLIACANLANLTLARGTLRSREIAVRLALGAPRTRIVAQLVLESFLLSLAGAMCGLLLARWAIPLILALKPPDLQRPELIGIHVSVVVFAAGACVLTAVLFGLAPAIAASGADLSSGLKAGGGWGVAPGRLRSRQTLIAMEVAMAVVLLTGAGLMIRSLQALISTGIGFETARLATVDIDLPEQRYPNGASRSRFFRELLARGSTLPGVTSAAVIDNLPLHRVSASNFFIAGRPDPPGGSLLIADQASVSPDYFRTLGLGLRAGRMFTTADLAFTEKDQDGVAIVNESFARQFFKGTSPLGEHLLDPERKHSSEIIGVITDYHPMGAENPRRPQIFRPSLKLASATVIARTQADPGPVTTALQNVVWSLDRDLTASKAEAMDYYAEGWQSQRRFNTVLLVVFAGLALVLALIGIHGVLASLVASRVREIGIRMAIGATPWDIARMVLRQGMIPVLLGVGAGLAGSLALGRFLESLLFQVRPRDPLALTLAALLILAVSPAAISVPLWRALRVDCAVALREE